MKLPSQSNLLLWAKTCVSSAEGYLLPFFCTADMMMDFPGLTKGHIRDIDFSNFLFCESSKEHKEVLTLNILHLLAIFAYYSNTWHSFLKLIHKMGRCGDEVCNNKYGKEAECSEFLTKLNLYDLKN